MKLSFVPLRVQALLFVGIAYVSSAYASVPIAVEAEIEDLASFHVPAQRYNVSQMQGRTNGQANIPASGRVITLKLRDVTLQVALEKIRDLGQVEILYGGNVVPLKQSVSVIGTRIPVLDALKQALLGTGIVVKVEDDGQLTLVRSDSIRTKLPGDSGGGTIRGRVIDSATQRAIAGVTITVPGTSVSVTTGADGHYVLSAISPGSVVVSARQLGYTSKSINVIVLQGAAATVDFTMGNATAVLAGVVTTATGQKKRFEVGNLITTLDVPSIIQNSAVTTLTDVLDGRVEGLVVSRSSGAPGAPARLRIRGIGSIAASDDPIIILNGARIYSNQTTNEANAAYSVLDQIDINTIESIDVLRGPSAAALYGSDAATGVIVITTKRGAVGKTRWSVSSDQQRTSQPGTFPNLYYREGISFGTDFRDQCMLGSDFCVADTLFEYNILGNPRYSVLGTGAQQQYAVNVSGGVATIQYFLGASFRSSLGLLRMSDADQALIKSTTSFAIPKWQRRPQQSSQTGGTSRVSMQVSPSFNVDLTTALNQNFRSTTPLDGVVTMLLSGNPEDTSIIGSRIPHFRQRSTYMERAVQSSLTSQWQPISQVSVFGDVGLQSSSRFTETLLRNGDCPDCVSVYESFKDGGIDQSRSEISTGSATLRASMQLPQRNGFRLTPSFGINYINTSNALVEIHGVRLAPGANSMSGVNESDRRVTASTALKSVSFGIFTNLGASLFNERVFASTGFRVDASNALGDNVRPVYPKFDVSYLLSRESFFPQDFATVRIRVAYGHAAVQPELGATKRTYRSSTGIIDGTIVNTQLLNSLGNTQLKPERSTEIEGGVDIGILSDRFSLGVTQYRKLSCDALVHAFLPASVGGGTYTGNLGSVQNSGTELTLNAIVWSSDMVRLSLNSGFSRNRNKLVTLSSSLSSSAALLLLQDKATTRDVYSRRYVEGYAVQGVWMRPVVAYGDINGDNAISDTELSYGDSSIYIGSPIPNYESTFGAQLGLWNSRVSVSTSMQYQDGLAQVNEPMLLNRRISREYNDPSASLLDQVRYRSGYTAIHNTSTLRLTSLSVRVITPENIARLLRASAMSISLQGSNLGVWTSYSGVDPNVTNSIVGNKTRDTGQLPLPRIFGVNISLNY